ncbi:hypothetical protein J6590_003496 [Homalodisca vitripennis]|nr:hypothetical protein J6590_003496 [Homalodisca vitripennis]
MSKTWRRISDTFQLPREPGATANRPDVNSPSVPDVTYRRDATTVLARARARPHLASFVTLTPHKTTRLYFRRAASFGKCELKGGSAIFTKSLATQNSVSGACEGAQVAHHSTNLSSLPADSSNQCSSSSS